MLTIYYKTLKDRKFKELHTIRPGSWINVVNATTEDLEKVSQLTGLSSADLADAMDRYELPRLERQEEGVILFTRYPTEEGEELFTELMTIILTDKYLITISPTKNPLIQKLIAETTSIATTQKAKLALKLLIRIATEYTKKTKQVRNRVTKERHEIQSIKSSDFLVLARSEEVLNQYLSALVPLNNALERLTTKNYITVHEEDKDILEDLIIAFKQSADICSVSVKSIRGLRDSYQVIFTNNLNKVIKLFTSLTIILTIPTIISSIYGMNVSLPLAQDPLAFAYIVWIIVFACASVFLLFYYKKWF